MVADGRVNNRFVYGKVTKELRSPYLQFRHCHRRSLDTDRLELKNQTRLARSL